MSATRATSMTTAPWSSRSRTLRLMAGGAVAAAMGVASGWSWRDSTCAADAAAMTAAFEGSRRATAALTAERATSHALQDKCEDAVDDANETIDTCLRALRAAGLVGGE